MLLSNSNHLFDNHFRVNSGYKMQGFLKIMKDSTEVKYLGSIPGMKFMLDECCTVNFEDQNIANAKSFYDKAGLKHGQTDDLLLSLATRYGYTLVTEDRGLIIMAYNKKIPIIYRLSDRRLFLVENPN